MKEKAYNQISELVKRFEEQYDSYKNGSYNETATRRDFIDPFFKALGWDIDNSQGAAEAYREVIHEDKVTIDDQVKSPDYSFRLQGGKRLFFVEAKKPSIFIKESIPPAYQVKRYAWSAKLPISILTDFEEFAVYDCTTKPKPTDKASIGRIKYLTFKEYLAEFDFLWNTFAKENVLRGSFDKFVLSDKGKKGTSTVDKEFLLSLDEWRKLLAVDISKNNKTLDESGVNHAVQQTIDRIIFLRICEDRNIEPNNRLATYVSGKNCYEHMFEYFLEADKKYNSGLFDFKKDTISKNLVIQDKVLKEIVEGLYYPKCPFEFSVLPVEILGSAYEQFLGKVIRLTAGHNAKVEEKPEVRKAGGVYYTPQYIVDYIVKNTVGKLVEGKTPEEVEKIKILDPACGSGSFLIGAYQYLLDWHLKYYNESGKKDKTLLTPDGTLTTAIKKKILLNNIFGVDLDAQAVEVTKLSLLLKCMEGETQASIKNQMAMFHERVLPSLETNIKCGNSLIGTDFYSGESLSLFNDDKERRRINAFDWNGKDGFQEIMKSGGFNAIIGNPPYVRQEILGEDFKSYAQQKYKTYSGSADLFVYFFEQSHQLLFRGGLFGMICSNKFMRANYGKPLRNFLSEEVTIIKIVDFGELPVFQNAATFPAIFLTSNNKVKEQKFIHAAIKRLDFQSLEEAVTGVSSQLDHRSINGDNWTLASNNEVSLIDKIKNHGIPLGNYVQNQIWYGVKTGFNDAFVIDEEKKKQLIKADSKSKDIIKPFLVGDDIRKYHVNYQDRFLIFTRRGIDIHKYPAIYNYLLLFKERLMPRPKNWKGENWKGRKPGTYEWYEIQDTVEYYEQFEKPKIIYPVIAKEPRFTIEDSGALSNDKTFIIPSDDPYLLGLLNSKLLWLFLKRLCSVLGDPDSGGRLELRGIHLCQLPIKRIDPSSKTEKGKHDKIAEMVRQILDCNKNILNCNSEHDKTAIRRQIDGMEEQIDKLVYELYGLTEDEIKIVEGQ
ncbi:MAG: Eco57I restriction-modification methylase domain-containing protein [Fibrobacteres bacterium]|nr:Eco57I restriction-modification methylase domain-containing protein [Fibrobacterota bacterium]